MGESTECKDEASPTGVIRAEVSRTEGSPEAGKLPSSVLEGDCAECKAEEVPTKVNGNVVSRTEGSSEAEINFTKSICLVGEPETPRVHLQICVNGKRAKGLVDTGAERNLIHESLARVLFGDAEIVVKTPPTKIRAIGESHGVMSVGTVSGAVKIGGVNVGESSFVVIPLVTEMSVPLILGMEFLQSNKLKLLPGERCISYRATPTSGYDWLINEDGKPTEFRLKQVNCVLTETVEVAPGNTVTVPIDLEDERIAAGLEQQQVASLLLVEAWNGTTKPAKMDAYSGIMSCREMKISVTNSKDKSHTLSAGTIMGVATTVVEVEQDVESEEWTLEQIKAEIPLGHLADGEREEAIKVIGRNKRVLGTNAGVLKPAAVTEHKIHLTDDTPVYHRPRRLPEPIASEVERQCKELESMDIIEESNSPWSAPVVPLRQPDGRIRLCIDYRGLNAQTKADRSPIPCLTDSVYSLHGKKYFTTLDLVRGYYQVPLSPESREFTAFSTTQSHYQFKRLSFGLRNAPAAFQREMQAVLSAFPRSKVVLYIDDILIMEESFEAHLELVGKVLATLDKHGMKIKASKCQWFQKEVDFLGHTISARGLRKQAAYVEKVESFQCPETVRELQQFLGLVNFQRKFVKDMSLIQKPLSEATRGRPRSRIDWTEERSAAFNKLKTMLKEDIELAFPCYDDGASKIELWVDASAVGAGACLIQSQEGEKRVIAYASMTFSPAQCNYSTIERELAALRWGVKNFKAFLYGVEFVIKTDHQPLVYLHSMRLVDGRLARTLADLADFTFSIEYVPGSTNTAADVLSRIVLHPPCLEESPIPDKLPNGLAVDGEPSPGGGDSLFVSMYNWMRKQNAQPVVGSPRELRALLMGELLKHPSRYGVKNPSREWRRDAQLRSMPGQLPLVEVLLVASRLFALTIQVYYWAGDPIVFQDPEITPKHLVCLQCLGGVHYNLLASIGDEATVKGVLFCTRTKPDSMSCCTIQEESDDIGTTKEEPHHCGVSAHPRILCKVETETFCGILDTGAEMSLIRRDAYERCSKVKNLRVDTNYVLKIEGLTGLISSTRGAVDLQLELENGMSAQSHTFALVEDHMIPHCFLLGLDFMARNHLGIDGGAHKVTQSWPESKSSALLPPIKKICKVSEVRSSLSEAGANAPDDSGCRELSDQGLVLVDVQNVVRDQESDNIVKELVSNISDNCPTEEWSSELHSFKRRNYKFMEDVLVCETEWGWRAVVSLSFLIRLAVVTHTSMAHIGRDKLLHLLRQHVFHPKMHMVIQDVCTCCPNCQWRKIASQPAIPPLHKIVTKQPFELVATDIVLFPRTREGFIGCVVVVDHNSKWVAAVPIKSKTAKAVVEAFERNIIPFMLKVPEKILSDNGGEFIAAEFREMLDKYNIKHILSTPYRPQSNGAIERVNRTIAELLRSMGSSTDWLRDLGKAVLIYNNTKHRSLGLSPVAYILDKSHYMVDAPVVSKADRQLWRQGHPRFKPYIVGDFVLRKTPRRGHLTANKLQARYEGPYVVEKVASNQVTYVLKRKDGETTIRAHYSQLIPWKEPPTYLKTYLPTLREDDSACEERVVDKSELSTMSLSESSSNEPLSSWTDSSTELTMERKKTPEIIALDPTQNDELSIFERESVASSFSGFENIAEVPNVEHGGVDLGSEGSSTVEQSSTRPTLEGLTENSTAPRLEEVAPCPRSEVLDIPQESCDESGFSGFEIAEDEIDLENSSGSPNVDTAQSSGNSPRDEPQESERSDHISPVSVYSQTPIINDKVLSRPYTRSRGPVVDLPNVQKAPIEYKSAQH